MSMTESVHNGILTFRCDKWAEFMDNAINGRHNPQVGTIPTSRRPEWDTKPWSGAESFDVALEYLTKGWDNGIKRLKGFQQGIPPDLFDNIMPVKDYKPEMRHIISGGGVDVAAHLSGATPEVFIGEVVPHDDGTVIEKGRKLQTVYMNITNSSSMSEAAFFYRGAYTFTLIEHLENCGYSVELWVFNYVQHGDQFMKIYVKVKEFGELFDYNKLAISMCSAFMLRRFMFSIMEQSPNSHISCVTDGSYGSPKRCQDSSSEVILPEDMDLHPMFIGTTNQEDPQEMLVEFKKILKTHLEGGVVDEKGEE